MVTSKSLKAGTIIIQEHLTFKRPAHGISPKDFEQVIGKKLLVDLEEDEQIMWKHLD